MADISKYGSFVATTNVYDLEGLRGEKKLTVENLETILVRLRQTINDIALATNIKDTGYYVLEEFVNGQTYFPDPTLNSTTDKSPIPRQVYRKVINFGALPNTTTKTSAHGLTIGSTWTFTRIYGCATDPSSSFIPIPYASATAADVIELSVDGTNVSVTTGKDQTGYTACYIVLEYIKE